MTRDSFFQFPQNHVKKFLLWLYLFFGTLPSFTLAATLHAIIMTDTTDSWIKAGKDRENIKQWVANVSEATGLNLKETVIDGEKGFFSRGSHEKVKNIIEQLPVMAKEDIVIFYYAGHGVNTDRGSRWPALDVEGEGTVDDQLVELSWVKEKLSSHSPRLWIAIADTCNEYLSEPSRGEGTILGGVGPYKEAYRKLFLGYQGIILATGSIPEQKSFHNNEGGLFTQKFLNTLKEELKSTNPDWENIRVKSIEDIPVMDQQSKQTPQMEVNISKVALEVASAEENPLVSLSEPVKPEIGCPQQTSTRWWACSQNTEGEEGGKKWNVFVEEKLWYNRWTGWYWLPDQFTDQLGHYVSATTADDHFSSILTLGYRYDKVSAALIFSRGGPQSFALATYSPFFYQDTKDTNNSVKMGSLKTHASAERQEMDVTLNYSLLPELQLGLGFKRVTLSYEFTNIIVAQDGSEKNMNPNMKPNLLEYDISGPTLNIGGQLCIANLIGFNLSMFGTFSYGVLKTDWGGNQNDYTRYHSTDLGLSWELPQLSKQVKSELRFGYRAQTIYTEAPMGDASDNTEGFTLGLRLVF